MSINCLPSEILQCILGYLSGQDVIRCRLVSRGWRAAVDGLPDTAWQGICHSQSYPGDYIAARNKYGLSWRDTFKTLNSWGNIHKAEMKTQELSINVQRFKVLPHGVIACLQNKRNNKNKRLACYSDTIVYYNLDTLQEINRDEFDFVFSSQLFECNNHFLILIMQDGKLCIVLRSTKKQFCVGTLVNASEVPSPPERFIGFTMLDKEVYFKNHTDEVIYVSKLVEVDGEPSISTVPLEAFKENHDSFEEDIVAFSLKDGNINILTGEGNIYIHNKTTADFEWFGGFDGRLPFIFNELEEHGFDWKSQTIYNWVATSSHLLIHPSHNAFYAHVRYGTGMIILIASKYFSHINIHNSKYCIDGLWGIVKAAKCKPIRAINVRKKANKHTPPVKHISQLDIVETPTSHKILALKQQRVYVFIFNIHKPLKKDKDTVRKKKVVRSIKAMKLRNAKQKAIKQTYTHCYATRSKTKQ